MYLNTSEVLRSTWIKDILKKNNNNRIEIKKLKGMAIFKWQNYCQKEITSEEKQYYSKNKILPLVIKDGTPQKEIQA